MFYITDLIEAKPGRESALKRELTKVIDAERTAATGKGIATFQLFQYRANPAIFLVYEVWESEDFFQAFHRAHRPAELIDFLAHADAFMTQPIERVVRFWNLVLPAALS